jgi:hypothetical protein
VIQAIIAKCQGRSMLSLVGITSCIKLKEPQRSSELFQLLFVASSKVPGRQIVIVRDAVRVSGNRSR